ncbi:MAG: large protein [Chitinophagaceae bacterium]|nr:large protein [Chitinophagaceae bacterium]
MKKSFLLSFFILLGLSAKLSAAIVYVNGSYTGSTEDGTSWATPYKTIEAAIAASSANDQLWIAKGTYLAPNDGFMTQQGYHIDKNLSLYGSFNGDESSIYERDLAADSTFLLGYLSTNAPSTIIALDINVTLTLDGFGFKNFSYAVTHYYPDLFNRTLVFTQDDRFNIKVNNCVFSKGVMPLWFSCFGNIDMSNTILNIQGTLHADINNVTADGSIDPKSNFKFTSVTFKNNFGPSFQTDRTNIDLFKCHFLNNNGRSVQNYTSGNLNVIDCDFNANQADIILLTGYQQPAKATVSGCTFTNNGVFGITELSLGVSDILIENSTFDGTKNPILSCVGATTVTINNIDVSNSILNYGNLFDINLTNAGSIGKTVVTNSRFTNNQINGGSYTVVSCYGNGESVNVSGCSFKNNTTLGTSGALTCNAGPMTIDNCVFDGNNASAYSFGTGAVYLTGSNAAITNCTFLNNLGARYGGALLIAAPMQMSNTTFRNNSSNAQNASIGGAITSFLGFDCEIDNCVFESNQTPYVGAVYCSSGTWTFNACKFKNNTSANAGAIRSYLGSVKIYNSLFDGNKSTAIYTSSVAAGALGLVAEIGTNHEIKNCTFVNNSTALITLATDQGGEVIWGYPTVSNSIFWNNGTRTPLTTSSSTYYFAKVFNSDVQGGYATGQNIFDVDPQFVDLAGGNYHLTCSSPLINKGSNEMTYSTTDLDNTTRIFAGTVDIGAYEFPQDPSTVGVPPQVGFTAASSACREENIVFQNTTTPLAGVRFEWNFGDGSASQLVTPTHSYQTAGTYTVTLKATNACGAFAQTTQTVTINAANAPSISFVTSVCPGQTTSFTTNATCTSLAWTIEGGTLISGDGTSSISVLWGDGSTGNGKVTLLATGCGTGLCETPVSIAIPIVPVNFNLSGPNQLCQGTIATYETNLKDYAPATLYSWSVKGGTITNPKSSDYGLTSVNVKWNSNDTLGVIYLNVHNELLSCTRTDSIRVKLRPQFSINGTVKVCEGDVDTYYTNVNASTYTWSVSGSGNTIDASSGLAQWSTNPGLYHVYAQVNDASQTCNTSDTVDVQLVSKPVVSAITGETAVLPNANESYIATVDVTTGVQYSWQVTGGTLNNYSGNNASITWGSAGPYGLQLTVYRSDISCASTPFTLPIAPDFIYSMSGPDTVCISSTGTFTATVDPSNSGVYTWTSAFTQAVPSGNTYDVTFDIPGTQSINLKVVRNGKEYDLFKNVYVKAAPTDIAITGPTDVDPQGTGTYTYTVTNSQNLNYNYTVIGASSSSKSGNSITVTWGGNEPFKIIVEGIVASNPCTGVPAVLVVKKALALSTQIGSEGSPCVNSRVKYMYVTDGLSSGQTWSVSSGGTIISNTGSEIIVEWASVGAQTVNFQYNRFGVKTFALSVDVKPLPTPAINDIKICGSNPSPLSTTPSYVSYKWYTEPNTISFSSLPQPPVTAEGQYRVEVVDGNGCSAFANKYIEQIPLPRVKIFSSDEFGYCQQTPGAIVPITMKTYEGQDYQYQWYANGVPTGNGTPILNTSISTGSISSVTYTVKVTLQTCSQESQATPISVYSCGGGNTCLAPAVSFTVSPGCSPFTFTNNSVGKSPSDIFGWTFGDGTSSTLADPAAKTYTDVGIFNVYLNRGCQSSSAKVIVPGLALFKVDAPGCKGQALTFNELSVNIPDYPVTSLTWDFGDGFNSGNLSGTSNRDIIHTYADSGTYNVTLTIVTTGVKAPYTTCTNVFHKVVKVSIPPVADFIATPPPCTDNTYKFTDHSVFIYSKAKYLWDFGNGHTSTLYDPSQKLAPGNQTIKLEVTDLLGCKGNVTKSEFVLVPNVVGAITITGDTTLCNGKTVTLTSPAGSSYVWKKDGVVLSNTTQAITVSAPGSYVVTYSVPGCDVTTLAVVLKNYTVPNLVSGNTKVCVGDALLIQTNLDPNKYSFAWKFNSTDLAENKTDLIINNAQLANAGNYTATVTDSKNGCILSLPAYPIAVYDKPVKPVITASQPKSCYDGSVTLQVPTSPTGSTFIWYKEQVVIAGEVNPSVALSHIVSANNYSMKLTDNTSGCFVVTDIFYVDVAPQIVVNVSGDQLACEYSSVSIGTTLSTVDYTFQWYKDAVAAGPNNSKYSIGSVALVDAGNYYVVATSKGTSNLLGCTGTSNTLALVVKAGPTKPVITGPAEFCSGSPITLTSNLTNNFVWNTGATTPSIPVSLGGSYTVTSTNPISGCSISTTATVIENPVPDLSTFFPTGVYERCASARVSFEGLDGYSNFGWYVNGVLFNTTNLMYPTKTGKYTLKITTDKGCVANSDTLRFTALKCPCWVKNTDNDGVNSLREAIQCSNANYGRDYIDFAIPGTGPFVIQPTAALPVLTDSVVIEGFTQSGSGVYNIVIDGSLYNANGLTFASNLPYNDVSGLTFSNFANAITFSSYVHSSIIDSNVFVNNSGSAIQLNENADNNTILNNSFTSSGTAITLVGNTSLNTIQGNTIQSSKNGIALFNASSQNTIRNNDILNNTKYGIWLNAASDSNVIVNNNILGSTEDGIYINNSHKNTIDTNFIGVRANGVVSANGGNGIYLNGTSHRNTIKRNLIGKNGVHGILAASSDSTIIQSNYIGVTNTANVVANTKYGIYVSAGMVAASKNQIANHPEYGVYLSGNSLLTANAIKENVKGGILVVNNSNKISKTVFTNSNASVKAIDQNASGNIAKLPAVFGKYRRSSTGGVILKGTALPGDTVEVFTNNNTAQQAPRYIGFAKADANGVFELDIPQGVAFDPAQKNYYVNTATDAAGNTSELSQPFMVGCFTCICLVTNTNDAGPGSLRGEIDDANTGGCLTINFSISTPDTIVLGSPLSEVLVPVTINGTQGGVDPLIFVKGNGLFDALLTSSDGVNVNNLGWTNFKNAITVTGDYSVFTKLNVVKTVRPVKITGQYNELSASAINTYSSKASSYITDTLVYVTGNNNQIGKINQGNRIVDAAKFGVLVSAGVNNSILYNEIFDNTVAITLISNGNNLQPVPYNMVGTTLSGVSSVTGKAKPNDRVQLFMSTYEPEQAYTYAAEGYADGTGNWTIIVPTAMIVPNQNNYVVATATDALGNTSPLSFPVRIGTFVQICYVTNTLDGGKGSLREAVTCANLAGAGSPGVPARIVFQLPATPNEILSASGYTITNNYGVKINPYGVPVSIKAQSPLLTGFTWNTNNLEIKNLTFDNFATALSCTGTNAVIDSNQFINDGLGIAVSGSSPSVTQTITHNFFANSGAAVASQQSSLVIQNNTLGNKKDGSVAPLTEFGIAINDASTVDIENNIVNNISAGTLPTTPAAVKGVPLYINTASGSILNNTIKGSGSSNPQALHLIQFLGAQVNNNHIGKAQTGVLLESSANVGFLTNDMTEVDNRGFDVMKSETVLMVQNTVVNLSATGKPIDLHLNTSDSSNHNIPTPNIISSTFHNGSLFLIGSSKPKDYIELFYSDVTGNDLDQYITHTTTDSLGAWTVALPISAANAKNYYFKATARNTSLGRTSEASAVYNPDLKICLVTTTANAGIGSLRDAIDKANLGTCNLIQFDITGSATISPSADLPLITAAELIIDATSQSGYTNGSPTVELLYNSSQNYAFSSLGAQQFDVYGMKMTGYDTSIAITDAKIVELQYNELNDFGKAGIRLHSSVFVYGNIKFNNITSAGEKGIELVGANGILVDTNTVVGVSQYGIYSDGTNQKIVGNRITTGNTTSAVGIALQNGSDAYIYLDTIYKAYRGITIVQGARHRVNSNGFGTSNAADIQAGIFVNESAIFLDRTTKVKVYRNTVNGTMNGVYVQNSFKPTVQNTKARNVLNNVINIINCDSAFVNANTLDSVKTGIYVSASAWALISANNISHIGNYGVYLDTDADSSLLQNNNIGAEYDGATTYSAGTGVYIKSSDNVIGGFNADSVHNVIFHNKKGGIIVDGGLRNLITYNTFYENDISKGKPTAYAIALINSGNGGKAQPQITDHKYISGKLHLFGTSAAENDSVHVYIGDGGYEEARLFMGSGLAPIGGGGAWEVVIDTTGKVKPQSTLYLVSTATTSTNNTSPLSKMYILGDCYVTSLKDTTDNDYPMPNSLRMAVNCANGQRSHVGIYFKVDQYGKKDVELQMKLQPIHNAYGVHFNAKNLVTDNLLGGIDGSKLHPVDDTAWVVAKTQGPSVFDSLNVSKCQNGLLVLADSIVVNGFNFVHIKETALVARVDADSLIVSNSTFQRSDAGIDLGVGAKHVSLLNNSFDSLTVGVNARGNDNLLVNGNVFGQQDSLNIVTALSLQDAAATVVSNNTFTSLNVNHKALLWNNVKGSITSNTFHCNKAVEPVKLENSSDVAFIGNTFTDSSSIYLTLEAMQATVISGNNFQRPDVNSVQVNHSSKIQIKYNTVSRAVQDAFDINFSTQVFISKNIVTNVRYTSSTDSALCINIHEGQANEANLGKPRPAQLRYSVKKGSDNRRGLFVQGQAEAGDSIEVFFSDSISASMNQYVVSTVANSIGLWEALIPRSFYYHDTTTWYHVIAVAIKADSNTSKTSGVLHIPPVFEIFYVRNDYDSGANSLRDALEQVNASDFYSRVIFQIDYPEFQPGPYHIHLDSMLDPIYSYMGYEKDGNTQLGKGAGPDQRIIVEGGKIGSTYGFDITDSSDVCKLRNIWFNDAKKGMHVGNDGNDIQNFHFITSDITSVQDTAFVITGHKNKVSGIEISNYKAGLIFTEGAGENKVTNSRVENASIAVIASDSAYKNNLNKSFIYASSQIAILADSAAADNVFTNNSLGSSAQPIVGCAIKVNNTKSQTFTYNRISVIDPYADGSVSTAVLVTGNSSFNNFSGNKIGVDSLSQVVHASNVRAFTIQPSVDGAPSHTTIEGNEMAGMDWVAIYAESSSNDLIGENLIGTDTLRDVHGMDSTAIYFKNCNNMEASDNVIFGYKVYGIELVSSDNVKMNRNVIHSTFTNNKAININAGTAFESNGGLVMPVITNGILVDTQTVRISGTAKPNIAVELYQSVKDTIQSIAYVNKVFTSSDATGSWTVDVPRQFFSYAKQNSFVAQNHEGSRSSEFSVSYTLLPILCQLAASNPALHILDPLYTPCPGPPFVLDPGLDEGLHYSWKSDAWDYTLTTRKASMTDSAPNLVLNVTDDFGCALTSQTDVIYKLRPIDPDFIVSSQVYTNDTIVMVDVSLPVPTEYTWNSTPSGVTILRSGAADTLVGDDGNVYPKNTRYVEFILPDSGKYTITQKSLRNGCFVELSKDIVATGKDPNNKKPYFIAPEIVSLSAFPNPSNGTGVQATLKMSDKEAVTLSLVSSDGVVLWSAELSGKTSYVVPLPDFNPVDPASGTGGTTSSKVSQTYYLKLTTASKQLVFKLAVL